MVCSDPEAHAVVTTAVQEGVSSAVGPRLLGFQTCGSALCHPVGGGELGGSLRAPRPQRQDCVSGHDTESVRWPALCADGLAQPARG